METLRESLKNNLNTVITSVFDNADNFVETVCPDYKDAELLEFYMASERCRMSMLSWDGVTFTDTVKTDDVLDWYNTINTI